MAKCDASRRIESGEANDDDTDILTASGIMPSQKHQIQSVSLDVQTRARLTAPAPLNYLILVPTLRCNLSCSYCQVSRADIGASGYDWSDETLASVLSLLGSLDTALIKIEFQGGEPTLRLDHIRAIIAGCERFERAEFVICTNLSTISNELRQLLTDPRVHLSTSLDGDRAYHQAQRTASTQATDQFFVNLTEVLYIVGPDRLSALPTIDPRNPPDPDVLLDAYQTFGLRHIFLRPINFQGFARKRHPESRDEHSAWWAYLDSFYDRIFERNYTDRSVLFEETYLTLCLKRMFRIGVDGHVDLRNPNPVGHDYIVIDYDGAIYPTDEARMLTRSGVVDLRIGSVTDGYDSQLRQILDHNSTNLGDPDCEKCVYQAFCGRDVIDDLARYGRIDMPRRETFFCQKHLRLFDLAMRFAYSDDAKVQYSLARWLGLSGDRLPTLPTLS